MYKEIDDYFFQMLCFFTSFKKSPQKKPSRTKLDPNREIGNAAQNQPLAVEAYLAYHGAIKAAAREIEAAFGHGTLYDLHGQAHRQNSTEVGYLLTSNDMNAGRFEPGLSSIRALAERFAGESDFVDLVNGPRSFGAFLEGEGYDAFPSPRQPVPGMSPFDTFEPK